VRVSPSVQGRWFEVDEAAETGAGIGPARRRARGETGPGNRQKQREERGADHTRRVRHRWSLASGDSSGRVPARRVPPHPGLPTPVLGIFSRMSSIDSVAFASFRTLKSRRRGELFLPGALQPVGQPGRPLPAPDQAHPRISRWPHRTKERRGQSTDGRQC